MKIFEDPVARLFAFPLLFIFSLVWYLMSFRVVSVPLLVAVFAFYYFQVLKGKRHVQFLIWLMFLGSTFLPIDISFANYPGSPRFVPLVMGMPTYEAVEAANRGECVLGGCMVSGYEPEYVWVW